MAQEVERILGKDEVTGSTPVISSKKEKSHDSVAFLFLLFIFHYSFALYDFS